MSEVVLSHRGAEILFDVQDRNIRLLESLFHVQINARGERLFVKGEEQHVVVLEKILEDFSDLVARDANFSNGDLQEAFEYIAQQRTLSLKDFFLQKPITTKPFREVVPRSPNQIQYIRAIENTDLIFSIGPAGTGKTYLAVAMAISFLVRKQVHKIVLARPAVEAGERLGFLPGDMQEKINPYLRPLYDALFHILGNGKAQKLVDQGVIEVAPLAFMRGRTLSNAFIILDEAQNCSSEQMKMFLTRIGLNSKAVVTGDITQTDLPSGQKSGLVEAEEILSHMKEISFCNFNEKDSVRHRIVKLVIQAYSKAQK